MVVFETLYRKKTIRLRAVVKKIKSLERFPPSATSGSKRNERPMSSVGLLDEQVPKSQAPPNSGTQNHSTQVQSTLRKGTQTHGTQTQSARRCTQVLRHEEKSDSGTECEQDEILQTNRASYSTDSQNLTVAIAKRASVNWKEYENISSELIPLKTLFHLGKNGKFPKRKFQIGKNRLMLISH